MACDALDPHWLRDHPLPGHEQDTDKNGRGRVLAVGGAVICPGGVLLTGEAALRAGAGKVRLATVAEAAMALAVALPESAVLPLPSEGGEIATEAADLLAGSLERCDALVVGPGMGDRDRAADLLGRLLPRSTEVLALVLDAAAVAGAGSLAEQLRALGGRTILTPHAGEMAALTDCSEEEVAADPEGAARAAAQRYEAVIALKGPETVIAAPDGRALRYTGGGVGLATGGSGDVLAGIIAGLAARGTAPFEAACWGVWIHGEAGRRLGETIGDTGFLARELLPLVPGLMRRP